MLTPLYIEAYRRYPDAIQHDKAFFQLCCNHLGFLVDKQHFDFKCRNWGGPEFGVGMSFFKNAAKIDVDMLSYYGLPVLIVPPDSLRIHIRISELAAKYGFEGDESSFVRKIQKNHPIDGLGEDVVRREYRDVVENRIARIGICISENMEIFRLNN